MSIERFATGWRAVMLTPPCVIVIDLLSKYLAERTLSYGESVRVLGDLVRFTLIYNEGTTFGLFAGSRAFLAISIVKLILIGALLVCCLHVPRYIRGGRLQRISYISLMVVIGGSCGNLIDRLIDRTVTDFIDVGFETFRWFVFNVADGFQAVGGLTVLAIILWQHLGRKETESEA